MKCKQATKHGARCLRIPNRGIWTSLEEELRLDALPSGSCTSQEILVVQTIQRHVSRDEVYTFDDLLKEL